MRHEGTGTTAERAAGRRSSTAVVIGAVGALSLSVAGCSPDDTVTAHCVDRDSKTADGDYRVVDEDNCDTDHPSGTHGGGYFFYYGGKRSGATVSGGSTAKPANVTVKTERGTTISRDRKSVV